MYTPKQFNLPTLDCLSEKQIDVHLKLYQGYVTHVNLIREKIEELNADKDKNSYLLAELRRRFAFEFNGMRMHEYYFEQFENGHRPLESSQKVAEALSGKYGSMEESITHLKEVASSRGIGWAVIYWDPIGKVPHTVFVGDHELGQLAGLPVLVALDMWEHAYMVDYTPAEKKNYVDAFLKNMNWTVAEKRFTTLP